MSPRLQELRARIERGAYHVDARKVAEAIAERLIAGRSVNAAAEARRHP